MVDEFVNRVDIVLPWDASAVDQAAHIKKALINAGASSGANDSAITGHTMAESCILVSNNTREFIWVDGLQLEEWVNQSLL